MRTLMRLGAAVLLVGMPATSGPPAAAQETGFVKFTGRIRMGPGIANMCVPPDDAAKCPGNPVLTPKQDGKGLPIVNLAFPNQNSANFTFDIQACAGFTVTVGKNKQPTHGPVCLMVANGTWHGYCSLATGTLTGALAVDRQVFTYEIKFTNVGHTVTLTGSVHKHGDAQSGNLNGEAFVTHDPFSGSCFSKDDAKDFLVDGSMLLKLS